MKPNLDKTARAVRVIFATAIGVLYFTGIVTGILGIILLVLAAMMLLTGLMRFCPMAMVGICPERLVYNLFARKKA